MTEEYPAEIPNDIEEKQVVRERIKDIYSAQNLAKFKEQLSKSDGKAMFIVHPFFEAGTAQFEGYLDMVLNDNSSKLKQYWTELGTLMKDMQEHNIPLVIMQEVPHRGEKTMNDVTVLEDVYQSLMGYLEKTSEIDPTNVHVIYTERGSPHPLKESNELGLSGNELVTKRMSVLKQNGLKQAFVAGMHYKPSEGDDFEYYPPAERPMDGFKQRTYEDTYGNWRLYDYYASRGQMKHPFAIVRPDHCFGECVRMLASNDIKPAITAQTYPEKVGRGSDYEQVSYVSKHTPEAKPEKVFKKKSSSLGN